MLEVRNFSVSYGAAPAISGVNLAVASGMLVVVVGPNGAGKSTLINAIGGLHPPDGGSLSIYGKSLMGTPAHRYCDYGIALVPEGRRLFTGLTVLENLELGSYRADARRKREETLEEVCTMFPVLKERLAAVAGTLSGGQQQMVAIGRALMARPKLLLLDEPSLGLAPLIVAELFRAIRRINAAGVAVLLVEQNVAAALDLAHRAYVLEEGRIVAKGKPRELAAQPHIQRAYLGLH
jgi:branched-chain amino acid transport system ATP-binding protein